MNAGGASAATPNLNTTYVFVNWHSGKAMDVYNWATGDGAPEELRDSYAQAYCHLLDAPDARQQIADPRHDRDRVRRWEGDIRRGGQQLWVCAAVVERTVVAFTEIEVGPEPAASQHATVVLPDHRRRGAGNGGEVGAGGSVAARCVR